MREAELAFMQPKAAARPAAPPAAPWASTTSTPPSTTTPAWPTARSTATRRRHLRRAATFFTASGIDRIERLLTDNAWPYRKSFAWQQALADLGASRKLTPAYRPQTNGKVERFNRTLLEECASLEPYTSNDERTAALADFLRTCNHHRGHSALGGQPPISRVNNAAGQYT
ncbi:hypothetical protein GCM10010269_30920 [Streptomyces humidus]|uniref:Integrase catalytic domain-containing protein n=1 Tax=Streptomyces humidus TaxID=52259 RepID=A0A918FV43_9ACTN|nr:hypothetical protein GCM10010269_30920 [Streptomyces humidus]